MNEAESRGRGKGRPPPGGVTRGGPNTRRGVQGGPSGGRGRGVAWRLDLHRACYRG